jgi:hypothetical protein
MARDRENISRARAKRLENVVVMAIAHEIEKISETVWHYPRPARLQQVNSRTNARISQRFGTSADNRRTRELAPTAAWRIVIAI